MIDIVLVGHLEHMDCLKVSNYLGYYSYLNNLSVSDINEIKKYLENAIPNVSPKPPERWLNIIKCCVEVLSDKRDDTIDKIINQKLPY